MPRINTTVKEIDDIKAEIDTIKDDIKDIRNNHLKHIEESVGEIEKDQRIMKEDIVEIKAKVEVLDEMKSMLQDNFSKIIQALIAVTLASMGAQQIM